MRGHGIRIKASSDVLITDPLVYRNVGHGIIILNNGARVTVRGTTVTACRLYENRRSGVRVEGATAHANLDTVLVERCTAYGNGDGFYSMIAQNVTFKDLVSFNNTNILNGTSEGYGIAIQQTLNATVEGNTLFSNRTDGLEVWGNATLSSNNCRVFRNTVYGHTLYTLDDSGSNGIEVRTGYSSGCRVFSNVLYGNTRNFRLGNDVTGTSVLANNTVDGGSYSIKMADSLEAGTNATTGWLITNNIFRNPTTRWLETEVASGNSNTFAKNDWVGTAGAVYNGVTYTSGTITTVDSTALTSDPLFVSVSRRDYRLVRNSSLKNAGNWWGNDCVDVLRFPCFAGQINIGAYQFSSDAVLPSATTRTDN